MTIPGGSYRRAVAGGAGNGARVAGGRRAWKRRERRRRQRSTLVRGPWLARVLRKLGELVGVS